MLYYTLSMKEAKDGKSGKGDRYLKRKYVPVPEVLDRKKQYPKAIREINLGKWEQVVELLTEPGMTYTREELSAETGVPIRTLFDWSKMPAFRRALHIRTVEKLQERLPSVLKALYKQAEKGNIKAIELFLKVTGTMIVDNLLPASKFAGLNDLEFKEAFIDAAQSIAKTQGQLMKKFEKENQ